MTLVYGQCPIGHDAQALVLVIVIVKMITSSLLWAVVVHQLMVIDTFSRILLRMLG